MFIARLGTILLGAGALVVLLVLPSSELLRRYDLFKHWTWGVDWKTGGAYHVLFAINGKRLIAGGALTSIAGAVLVLRALL